MIAEHALPKSLCRRGQPLRVPIVGAGGNGSAVLLGPPYLHQAMKVWGHAGGIHVGMAAERIIRHAMELLPQLIRERRQETLKMLVDTFLAGVKLTLAIRQRSFLPIADGYHFYRGAAAGIVGDRREGPSDSHDKPFWLRAPLSAI